MRQRVAGGGGTDEIHDRPAEGGRRRGQRLDHLDRAAARVRPADGLHPIAEAGEHLPIRVPEVDRKEDLAGHRVRGVGPDLEATAAIEKDSRIQPGSFQILRCGYMHGVGKKKKLSIYSLLLTPYNCYAFTIARKRKIYTHR